VVPATAQRKEGGNDSPERKVDSSRCSQTQRRRNAAEHGTAIRDGRVRNGTTCPTDGNVSNKYATRHGDGRYGNAAAANDAAYATDVQPVRHGCKSAARPAHDAITNVSAANDVLTNAIAYATYGSESAIDDAAASVIPAAHAAAHAAAHVATDAAAHARTADARTTDARTTDARTTTTRSATTRAATTRTANTNATTLGRLPLDAASIAEHVWTTATVISVQVSKIE